MNVIEYEKLMALDNTLAMLIRGIDDHLHNDELNPDLITDPLCLFNETLHDAIVSFKPTGERR